ncbi:MAG: hypothetical protein DRJ42_12075 [Deltaproteobacteria bacterium]|nr:MAG: hypothetical protein DRJ42_12075 [Deltaproteobacteria bacterium]
MMIPQKHLQQASVMLAATLLCGFVCSLLACGETSPAAREPSHQTGEPSRQVGESSPPAAASPDGTTRIEMRCLSGPIPAPPGDRPVRSRSVEIYGPQLRRIVEYTSGATFVRSSQLSETDHRHLADLSMVALERGAMPPEARTPDGMWCVLEVTAGGDEVTLELALPAASSSPNPLRDSLVALLPETLRPAGQRDADLEADEQRCRELAAASVAAQGEWDLVEVRVDEQERVFFYYQRQVREGQVASSGGHFACRVDDGELLLLLEG